MERKYKRSDEHMGGRNYTMERAVLPRGKLGTRAQARFSHLCISNVYFFQQISAAFLLERAMTFQIRHLLLGWLDWDFFISLKARAFYDFMIDMRI
jgi:hypothetical protein